MQRPRPRRPRTAGDQVFVGNFERISGEIADILLREGIDHVQTKAVFNASSRKAGLKAPKKRRPGPPRRMVEEQLRFIDAAYARDGQSGLMIQTLPETWTHVSEFMALCVEDVSLGERVIAVESGKRCEVPIRTELARLLTVRIGRRRAGPLFVGRETGCQRVACLFPQRIGQMVRRRPGSGNGSTSIRLTMATRLLAIGTDITDIQTFLGHADIGATPICAETSVAMLQHRFEQVADPAGRGPLGTVRMRQWVVVGAFAADLLCADRRDIA